jgi:D-alanyl-D-alanine carboxypeptidase
MRIKVTWAAVAASILASHIAAQELLPLNVGTAQSDHTAALSDVAKAWIDRTGLPGVTIAAITADDSLVKVAAGVSRIATGEPMRPDDRMFAGSIGKTYFGAIALQLVEEGKLSLDDKVETVVGKEPWFAGLPNGPDITLRMLLNHTSGIKEHVDSPEFLASLKTEPLKEWDFGLLLKRFVCGREPLFPAGEGWSYADTNYIVAGLMIEKTTGKKAYDLIRERLLIPLQLADTIPATSPEIPGLITGYEGPRKIFTEAEEVAVDGRCVLNPQFEWAGGGFVSTSPDLARWARALWTDGRAAADVLRPETRAEVFKGVKENRTGPKDSYGLGVIIWESPLGRTVGHTGMFPGYVSQVFHFEAANVTVAMQCNSMDFSRLKAFRNVVVDAARAVGAKEPQ